MSQKFTKILGLLALTSMQGVMDAQKINWAQAGPIYTAGRIRNMIIDKNDPTNNTLYVGSVASGIFISTNSGKNWAPINDQGTVRNISYLAQSVDKIIYAATGEGFLRYGQKSKAQPGTGLYKLSGTNLVQVASSAITGTVINRIACSPVDANKIAIATNLGILVSNNGGASFSSIAGISSTVDVAYGMDVKFSNSGILYCSVGNERGHQPFTNVSGKVYKSTDANLTTFTNITPTANVLTDSNYGRIEIAIAPSNDNVIYVSCANKNTSLPSGGSGVVPNSASLNAIFVSYDGGNTWGLLLQGSPQQDPLSNGGTISSGDYAHVITVSPNNPDWLFIGGYNGSFFRRTGGTNLAPVGQWSSLGFSTIPNTQFYVHENIHDIKFTPNGSFGTLFIITDGGIFRDVDGFSSQPFYKGLVTGQFNSVSIEKYPASGGLAASGSSVTPYSGFIGGTGSNGMVYYSGTSSNVIQESNYVGGEVYNVEYSKILNGAAYLTSGNGTLFKTANAKSSSPAIVNNNKFSGALSKIAPAAVTFFNDGYSTGTPFKLWENLGTVSVPPDSAVFYNDSLRLPASMSGIPELTSKTTFTFSALRPGKNAIIDSIVIRTGTITIPVDGPYANAPATAWSNAAMQDITMKPTNAAVPNTTVNVVTVSGVFTTVVTQTQTVYSGTNITIAGSAASTSSNAVRGVTLNATTLNDIIAITFTGSPFATFTVPFYPVGATGTAIVVPDAAAYYRVFATVFYKYKVGDQISVVDNNISTKTTTYSTVLSKPLSWNYGSFPGYTLTAPTVTAITNPTYVLSPDNISQTNPTFVVAPTHGAVWNYSITQLGTYALDAVPVDYNFAAPNNTTIPNPTFVINPGGTTNTTGIFIVTPTVATTYTITQTGTGTLTANTFSSVGTPTYILNPGNITQSTTAFAVTHTAYTTYSIQGISTNTVANPVNTSTTYVTARNTYSVGRVGVPFCKNNIRVKIPMPISARLAVGLKQTSVTDNQSNPYAIAVSKAPLNLNDPLNFIRISQSGCFKDDANGSPTFSTIAITGTPTVLEWSKGGLELYYATNTNNLYRVSHIYSLMDLSQSSYSGKFFTDVFKYKSSITGDADTNRISPYRTTLLGSFSKPITSISVSNDDKNLAITFNDPAPTGTNAIVMYNTNDARKSDNTNIGWVKKDGSLANIVTYCSLMEMKDSKKVFIGTDNGIFYTNDITAGSPTWVNSNALADDGSKLPNVQVFDIKQQTLNHWDCYNSGQIYVATNGRGVWTTSNFLNPFYVSIEERAKAVQENNLSLYPNPTNGKVTVLFNSLNGEKITLQVIDISGRVVKSENIGVMDAGDVEYSFDTSSLNSGIYIVNLEGSSNTKRIAKLVVTK